MGVCCSSKSHINITNFNYQPRAIPEPIQHISQQGNPNLVVSHLMEHMHRSIVKNSNDLGEIKEKLEEVQAHQDRMSPSQMSKPVTRPPHERSASIESFGESFELDQEEVQIHERRRSIIIVEEPPVTIVCIVE